MSQFEIEIKSLLGEKKNQEALKAKMEASEHDFIFVAKNTQLNHYFTGGDIEQLFNNMKDTLDESQQARLRYVIENGEGFSVRTRQKDDEVLLVVKASLDGGTSENTVQRMEFEEAVAYSLTTLDQLVLDAGFSYQAKWSREREEYTLGDTNICFDKNAGYGYLIEFEKVVKDESLIDTARDEIMALMNALEVEELDQDRLARMFDYYNKHWEEYYGTEKTFTLA